MIKSCPVFVLVLATACGGQLLCEQDAECGAGEVCAAGDCTQASALTRSAFSASPASATVATTVGTAPPAAHFSLVSSSATSYAFAVSCGGATASPAAGFVSRAAAVSIAVQAPAQATAGTAKFVCRVTSKTASTATATFTLNVSSSAGGGGGSDDGAPTRTASCTPFSQDKGTAINTPHGRLDGYVRYVVPKGGPSSCNGDSGHVHIQVSVSGQLYDIAVDVGTTPGDANLYEADMAMPGGAWSEGWHGSDALSYKALGVRSTQFTAEDPAALAQKLVAELATVNHISIFGTAYSTKNGCHDIHYYNGNDGALVLQPLSATPHVLFFRFASQSF